MLDNATIDIIVRLDESRSRQEVWSVVDEFLAQNGLTHSIYVMLDRQGQPTDDIWSSLPQTWIEHYDDRKYGGHDPYFRYCCNSFAPVMTGADFLPDYNFLNEVERSIIIEASEFGFRSGFSAPVRLSGSEAFGGWNFGSGMRRREFELFMRENGGSLQLLAFYIHEHLARLVRAESETTAAPMLSPRERECLLWLGRGMRTAAIADRLGLAEVTVDLHLKRARNRLGAATREEALVKALLSGQICP